jgi:hypothetical protein
MRGSERARDGGIFYLMYVIRYAGAKGFEERSRTKLAFGTYGASAPST